MSDDIHTKTDQVITYVDTNRRRMGAALGNAGLGVSSDSSLGQIADAVEDLTALPQVPDYAVRVRVKINAGVGAYIPDATKAAALLEGATVLLVHNAAEVSVPLASLAAGTVVNFAFPVTNPNGEKGRIGIRLNPAALAGTGIACPDIWPSFVAGQAYEFSLDLDQGEAPKNIDELGFRIFTGFSFGTVQDIIRHVDAAGVVTEEDTGYLDAATGEFVSTSPIERGVPCFDLETAEITEWYRHKVHKRNDLVGIADAAEVKPTGYWPFNAIKTHRWEADYPDGQRHPSFFVGIGEEEGQTARPYFWMKELRTTALLKTKQADGTFTTSEQEVWECYFAKEQLDAAYRKIELDYFGQYLCNAKSINVDDVNTRYMYASGEDNQTYSGAQWETDETAMQRNNSLANATLDGKPYIQKAHAFSGIRRRDYDIIARLVVMMCGTRNCQDYIWGYCAPFNDAAPDTGALQRWGAMKSVIDSGYTLAVHRDPAHATRFVMLGIEDIWGNAGYRFSDVVNIGGNWWYQPDKSKWAQNWNGVEVEGVVLSGDDLALHRGYRKVSVRADKTIQKDGWMRDFMPEVSEPNMLIPVVSNPSTLPNASDSCFGDACWHGATAGQAYFIAQGGFRGDGSLLGAWCVQAATAWSYAYGSNWSARPSLEPLG